MQSDEHDEDQCSLCAELRTWVAKHVGRVSPVGTVRLHVSDLMRAPVSWANDE